MTRQEAAQVLEEVAQVYPGYYRGKSREALLEVVEAWAQVFAREEKVVVLAAVQALFSVCRYPPSPAQVVEQMNRRGGAQRVDMNRLAERCAQMRRENPHWMRGGGQDHGAG